jgi:hypothetical protein
VLERLTQAVERLQPAGVLDAEAVDDLDDLDDEVSD